MWALGEEEEGVTRRQQKERGPSQTPRLSSFGENKSRNFRVLGRGEKGKRIDFEFLNFIYFWERDGRETGLGCLIVIL